MIPSNISVPICIEKGSIYHYRIKLKNRDGSDYDGERFFIVINTNPKTDEILVLTTITSKIEKQELYVKKIGEDPDTLVKISKNDFSCLTKDSVINCSNIYTSTMNKLIEDIDNGGKIFYEKLPKNIIDAITSGVLKSKLVPSEYKKLII